MPESPPLHDGQTFRYVSDSGSRYELKNVGGVYSCSCPGWRNQGRHPHYRTCKHLCDYRGARDEAQRIAPGGRGNHPQTVERLVAPYWPSTGAASARMNPAPEEDTRGDAHIRAMASNERRRAEESAGAVRAVDYNPTTRIVLPRTPVKTKTGKVGPIVAPAVKKPHNAWTALLDDDHPLAEPLPPVPPVNDVDPARPVLDDEPKWTAPLVDPSTPIDPASIISPPPRPVATKTAFRGVLLAESWDGTQNITGWVMSEKLDGVRAYWDGTNFYSRNGNIFAVPDWYKIGMPKDVHLDGEFWIGRGLFQKTSGYVRRMDRGEYWKTINYMIFDVPSVDDGFEARLAAVGKAFTLPTHAKLLPHAPCPSIDVLKTYLGAIEENGGEGVMLRRPGSRYVRTRSDSLLKVKTFFDTEAEVTGTTAGKGRHDGSVGALEVIVRDTITLMAGKKTCTIKSGTRFEVGTGLVDAQRRPGAIPISSIITCRFQELSTEGIPRFPSLIGVRDYE